MKKRRVIKYNRRKIFYQYQKKKKSFFGRFWWLFSLLLFAFLVFVYYFLLMPQITLKGERTVTLNYKENYTERGYFASWLGKNLTKEVQISGKVNSKKLGTYSITYGVKNGIFQKTVKRTIRVVDKSAPIIELKSRDDIYVCPWDTYKSEEYHAMDNYDGDVTKNVKVIQKKDKIIYEVVDQQGNRSQVIRKILYQDKEAPKIILEKGNVDYAFVGDNYIDPGYWVTDNCDGILTSKVTVSGSVDTTKAGESTLTYWVKDKAGNKGKITRKVIVSERGQKGTIYLTFDDGPKEGTTDAILDILRDEGIKATFFVTNRGPDYLIKREYEEGHTVALHTASHDYALVYASMDAYFNDLLTVQDRVKRITGYEAKIIRFPGGSSNTVSRRYNNGIMTMLTSETLRRGFRYYDWNLSSGDADAGNHTGAEIARNVTSHLSKERINMVLMHDIKPYTRDALREIIHYGKEQGYTFEAITMNTEMVTQRVNN